MEKVKLLKTPGLLRREERDSKIFNRYQRLMSVKGQSKGQVVRALMRQYGFDSPTTIYNILRRVEDKMKSHEQN